MDWSTKRKLTYLSILLLVILVVAAYFLYPLFIENPTCSDGKQNGDEVGVDCGGICNNFCASQVRPLSIIWQRSFEVAPGIYDVLGYVENQNADAGVSSLLYRFKLYDDKNVLIAERDGKTFIGPNQSGAIFSGGINTGERIPKLVYLEFEDYQWTKIDPRFLKINFSVKNQQLLNASTSPRLAVSVGNESLTDLRNVEAAAILRDQDDNAIAVSNTVIESLPKQSSKDIFFTWLTPLELPVARIEIIPRVNPFTVSY
ncbi:MAG: hypothetical protein WC835_00090 [Candidatus Paceibacterota bacterium]